MRHNGTLILTQVLGRDRIKSDELLMTQEFISNMLDGRRERVTVAAGHLQDTGLIHYVRGRVTILDRRGLEARVCERYHIVRVEVARLAGHIANPSITAGSSAEKP